MADVIIDARGDIAVIVPAGVSQLAPILAAAEAARDAVKPLYGEGAPTPGLGIEGSVYYDTTDPFQLVMYGPKTEAGWGAGRSLKGEPGAAGNVAANLAQLKDAAVANDTMLWGGVPFKWETDGAPYTSDEASPFVTTVESDHEPLSVGAWVRQPAEKVAFGMRSVGAKLDEIRSVTDHGAAAIASASVNHAAFQAAVAQGGYIRVPSGGVYEINDTITISENGTVLEIEAGATVKFTDGTKSGLLITADQCQITGSGILEMPDDAWNGTNSQQTYANIWVTGDYCRISGIIILNVPRSGIHYSNCIPGGVSGCIFMGGFPYSDYAASGGLLTAQSAIYWDPPASTSTTAEADNAGLLVEGCTVHTCIQGVLVGNLGSPARSVGVNVNGCLFTRCWDHAIYAIGFQGTSVCANTFLNCRVPIVVDGRGARVCDNVLYAFEDAQLNSEQSISVRDATDATVSANFIYGRGASINVAAITGTVLRRNKILDNTVWRTGDAITAAALGFGIRLHNAITCEDNVVEGNTIGGAGFGNTNSVIQITMGVGAVGRRNKIRSNDAFRDDEISSASVEIIISANNQDYLLVEGNNLYSTAAGAGSGAVMGFVWLTDCNYYRVRGNEFHFPSGGANVNARGVHVAGTSSFGLIEENEFFFTSGSIGTKTYWNVLSGTAEIIRNRRDQSSALGGTAQIDSGASSEIVANANVHSGSRVVLTPRNAAAAALWSSVGVYVTVANGSLTVSTGDGTNAPAACEFNWELAA